MLEKGEGMDKSYIEAEARIAALEGITTMLFNIVLTTAGLSGEQIDEMGRKLLDNAARATTSLGDPAMSDHVADEVRLKLERLLSAARVMRQP